MPLLRQFLFAGETDAMLRKAAAAAIVQFGEAGVEILQEALASNDTEIVLTTLYEIRRVTNPMLLSAIEALLRSPDQRIRDRAEVLHQRATTITGDAILIAASD